MDISLFMSAARPKWWQRMYESLEKTQFGWEIVAVGPNPPTVLMPPNFRYYKCDFKPCQCYAAASYLCKGDVIGWTADDAVYSPDALDVIMSTYYASPSKSIFVQRTIENGKDVTEEHHFIRHDKSTPQMAPMAFMNKKWFFSLGGYDRNHVAGQAENSIVMSAFSDGGKIVNVLDSKVYLNHEEVHGGIINKLKYKFGKNSFRSGYWNDRRYLEECWVKYGKISDKRLLALHPFDYNNILTVPQGPQGRWGK